MRATGAVLGDVALLEATHHFRRGDKGKAEANWYRLLGIVNEFAWESTVQFLRTRKVTATRSPCQVKRTRARQLSMEELWKESLTGWRTGQQKTKWCSSPSLCRWQGFYTSLDVVFLERYLGSKISSGEWPMFLFLCSKMWASWSAILQHYVYGSLQCAPLVALFLKVINTCVMPTASHGCRILAFSTLLESNT